MKKTRCDAYVDAIVYWCGRLGMPKVTEVRKDNRFHEYMAVIEYDKNKAELVYNARRLGHLPVCQVMSMIFHEIGHLKHKMKYETEKQQVESEYRAEKYSQRMMKRYYPHLYKDLLKDMKDKKAMKRLQKECPIHYQAYRRIKDYRNTEV